MILDDTSQFTYNVIVVILITQILNLTAIPYIYSHQMQLLYKSMITLYCLDYEIQRCVKKWIRMFKFIYIIDICGMLIYFTYATFQNYCGNVGKVCGFLAPLVSIINYKFDNKIT